MSRKNRETLPSRNPGGVSSRGFPSTSDAMDHYKGMFWTGTNIPSFSRCTTWDSDLEDAMMSP